MVTWIKYGSRETDYYKQCNNPINRCTPDRFSEDAKNISRVSWREQAVQKEKDVPAQNAPPYDEMANPSEMGNHQSNLTVYCPDYARICNRTNMFECLPHFPLDQNQPGTIYR
ncbi:Uncharacterized protein Fot_37792 [Forsythia ovata]|uniref:Uncharacterized protein n=1 Tax=Forsythia ovata TaxID=205694 RepID=A0ABD1S008_9LAMI